MFLVWELHPLSFEIRPKCLSVGAATLKGWDNLMRLNEGLETKICHSLAVLVGISQRAIAALRIIYIKGEKRAEQQRESERVVTHTAPAPMLMSPQGSKYKDFALRRCMAITLIGADFARRSLLSLALRYDDAHSAKILSWRSCTRYILVRRISSDLTLKLKQWQSTKRLMS